MGIILFFVLFGVVVVSHELGHFLVGRAHGIRVKEFAVGMGPRLLHFEKNGVSYALRLLPIGGACMFDGEDGRDLEEAEEDGTDTDEAYVTQTELGGEGCTFPEAPLRARFLTLLAGPGFNFILAFLFSLIIVGSYGVDLPVIAKLSEDGAAIEAGLQEGDIIVAFNNKKIHLYREISLFSMLYEGGTIEVTYERDGKQYHTNMTPKYNKEEGHLQTQGKRRDSARGPFFPHPEISRKDSCHGGFRPQSGRKQDRKRRKKVLRKTG